MFPSFVFWTSDGFYRHLVEWKTCLGSASPQAQKHKSLPLEHVWGKLGKIRAYGEIYMAYSWYVILQPQYGDALVVFRSLGYCQQDTEQTQLKCRHGPTWAMNKLSMSSCVWTQDRDSCLRVVLPAHWRPFLDLFQLNPMHRASLDSQKCSVTLDLAANSPCWSNTKPHLDLMIYEAVLKEKIVVGDVVYIEANASVIKVKFEPIFKPTCLLNWVILASRPLRRIHCIIWLESKTFVPLPKVNLHKRKELVQDNITLGNHHQLTSSRLQKDQDIVSVKCLSHGFSRLSIPGQTEVTASSVERSNMLFSRDFTLG